MRERVLLAAALIAASAPGARAAPRACVTIRGCVDEAMREPTHFAQDVSAIVAGLPMSERVVCLGFLDPNELVQAYVRRACMGGRLDASCGAACLDRMVDYAVAPERPMDEATSLLGPLFDDERGQVRLPALLARDDAAASAVATLWLTREARLPMTAAQRARAEGLVWKRYLVERTHPPVAGGVRATVAARPQSYRARVLALVDADLRAGKLDEVDNLVLAAQLAADGAGRLALAKQVLPLTRDLEPEVAAAARALLLLAVKDAGLARWPKEVLERVVRALDAEAQARPAARGEVLAMVAAQGAALARLPGARALVARRAADPDPAVRAAALTAEAALGGGVLPAARVEAALGERAPEVLAALAQVLPAPLLPRLRACLAAVDARLFADARWQAAVLAMGLRLEAEGGPFHRLRDEDAARPAPGVAPLEERKEWDAINTELFGIENMREELADLAAAEGRAREAEARARKERARRLDLARRALP